MPAIYFSDKNRTEVYQVPILPEDMPELNKTAKNEEFDTFDDGVYNFLGNVGLVTFSIDSFLPEYAGKYSWAQSQIDPYKLVNLWSYAMEKQQPLRCVMERTRQGQNSEILNWLVSVENMSWYTKRNGDIKYKADFKEYREAT